MNHLKQRRKALKKIALGAAAIGSGSLAYASSIKSRESQTNQLNQPMLKGNINHSVCRWCYGKIPLESFARDVKAMGLKSIELLQPNEWAVAKEHDLTCAIAVDFEFVKIEDGFNDPANHQHLQENYQRLIPLAAEQGFPTVICFSGNRRGISDEKGLDACAKGIEPLAKLAEKHDITLIIELLNSKVNHIDYQCDKTPWGVDLIKKVNSPNFKLLYDIYHMQIMEGDIIATIREYHQYIAHYHTGGVPGRNEINETQELNYPAIMKAILKTGYTGYVAQEFIPTWDDKIAALRQGVEICDV
jgi:hydroxypyruvate isomerase